MIDTLKRMWSARKVPGERHIREPLAYYGPRARSGVHVTETTALAVSTVWRCVNLISSIIAGVPWTERMQLGGDQGSEVISDSPCARLFSGPVNGDFMSHRQFRLTLHAHKLLWGNGYAEIERDRMGRPIALWPLTPDRVTPARDSNGRLVYEIHSDFGNKAAMPKDVFHLRGLGWDGLRGYSVIGMARESVGLGIAAERQAAAWFGNGVNPGGVYVHPGEMSDEGYARLKKSLDEHRGPDNSGGQLLLEEGIKWEQIGMSAKDAEFIESRTFQVRDFGRWFGVPSNFLGDNEKATLNNFEQMVTMFLVNTVIPDAQVWEDECDMKLLTPASGRFCNMNFTKLMRGDIKSRAQFYKTMRELGAWTIDRILVEEDENPIGGEVGQMRLVPAQMMNAELVAAGANKRDGDKAARRGQKAEPPAEQPTRKQTTDEPQITGDVRKRAVAEKSADVLMPMAQAVVGRIIAREEKAVERAKKRYSNGDDYRAWLEKFAEEHRGYVVEQVLPLIETAYLVEFGRLRTDTDGQGHLELSARAADFADEMIQRLVGKSDCAPLEVFMGLLNWETTDAIAA